MKSGLLNSQKSNNHHRDFVFHSLLYPIARDDGHEYN